MDIPQRRATLELTSVIPKGLSFEEESIFNTLRNTFQLQSFRNGQYEIILSILTGKDTIAIMPTGGGKSLCYQLPSVLSSGTTVVFSPLISLMKDQVDSLRAKNIPAIFLNSSQSESTQKKILDNLQRGYYKILFVAPERLNSSLFQSALKKSEISFVVIDEAHCISEWGHNFRPSYLKISSIFNHIRRVPIAAFTATATPEVRKDIVKFLGMEKYNEYIKGFQRENLSFITEFVNEKSERLINLIRKISLGSKIVYVGTRKNAEDYSNILNKKNISSVAYHGGLPSEERKQIQEKFIKNEISTIVATNAFGMGIDKPDVRLVVHLDLPSSLEAYYQEAGRAGRDTKESECFLLYSKNDERLPSLFIYGSFPDSVEIRKVIRGINDLSSEHKNKFISGSISHLSSLFNIESSKLRTIFKLLARKEIIKFYDDSHLIRFKLNPLIDQLKQVINHFHNFRKDLFYFIQNNSDFNQIVEVDVNEIAMDFGVSAETIISEILSFESLGLINTQWNRNFSGIKLLNSELNESLIEQIILEAEERKLQQINKAEKVLEFLRTNECKQKYILEYFGEKVDNFKCEKCSSCRENSINPKLLESAKIHNFKKEISKKARQNQEIIDQISELSQIADSLETLAQQMKMSKPELANLMQSAIENGFIINPVKFISDEIYNQVKSILKKNSNFRLSQIRERLEIPCEFPELRIAVAFCRKNYSD